MKRQTHHIANALELPDCDIRYIPNFIEKVLADTYFDYLLNNVPWQLDHIKIFGKTYPQPRLTALYGNNGKTYSYSNITMRPIPFNLVIEEISTLLKPYTEVEFTSCLLNLYRTGTDSNGWHADDEKELGRNPVIASVSLGQERYFHLKHKERKDLRYNILLEPGRLLIMQGSTQHHWLHQIPKSKKALGPRINLTYRSIN